MTTVVAILITGLSISYCQDDFEQEFETNYALDRGMIEINETLCDYYGDQGYAVDDNDVPADNQSNLDKNYNKNAFF